MIIAVAAIATGDAATPVEIPPLFLAIFRPASGLTLLITTAIIFLIVRVVDPDWRQP